MILSEGADNLASSFLAQKTKKYWEASLAWNGKAANPLSAATQSRLLNESLRGEVPTQKLSYRSAELIHKLIMHGHKPKRGRKIPNSKVLELKRKEANEVAS